MCLRLRLRPVAQAGKGPEIFLLLPPFGFFSFPLAPSYVLPLPPSVTPFPPQGTVASLGGTGVPWATATPHTALSRFPCHRPAGESIVSLSLEDIQQDTAAGGRGPGGFWGLRTPWGGQEPPSPRSGRAFVPRAQPHGTTLCPSSAPPSLGHSPWVLGGTRGAWGCLPRGGCHPLFGRLCEVQEPHTGCCCTHPTCSSHRHPPQ